MTSNDRNLVTSKIPGTVLLMQNGKQNGHTKLIQIRQKETLSHQGAIIHENCCSAAQMIEFSEEGRRWVIKRTKMSCPLCKTFIGEKEVEKLMERKTPEVEILGSKLSLEKDFLDLKIICEGKEFHCHKNVLCCQSDKFKTMLLPDLSGEVEIEDITGKFCRKYMF